MEHENRFEASLSEGGRYRMLVDAITDYAIYMLDQNGIVTSWNPGARRFKGYQEQEILGEHFSRFYTDQDRAAGLPQRALETAAREGKFEAEGWRVRKDGSQFWAYVVIDPILEAAGNVIGYAKITRDLTERRAAEEELRKSEEQFKILVQGVTDYAIYMLGPTGDVASWNAGAQRIKGYRPEEIMGQHFSRFYTEDDRNAGVPQEALETAERVGRYEKEGLRCRKDGTQFWAHVIIDAIRSDAGKLIGFAKITRDITERKKTEFELEQARSKLIQAQKMEAIGQLTGGVAHDFNNLLMAIQGSLELLKRRLPEGDPYVDKFLDNALQGAKRGNALTQRMLAFARRQELKFESIDVLELVRGMTDLLQTSLGPSVQVETRFPLNLPKTSADANQLELALLNLAMNARDAMPQGGSIVIAAHERQVDTDPDLAPGNYICLTVADTGTGMDEQTLQRALEPFFTTKGVGKGTGLGLPMVFGMAEQSGGKLILRSELGKGTTVQLCLPVAAVTAEVEAEAATQPGAPKIRALHVLSVDDDPLVELNTSGMLGDLGHTVISASSGREALKLLRANTHIDLLITDQAMPGMTGSELAEAALKERPDLPIIIATGYAELPKGAAQNLPKLAKPFFQTDLAKAIADIGSFSDKG